MHMSFVLKDPEALLDYAVDWGAEYLSEVQVRQVGTLALSRPESILINL